MKSSDRVSLKPASRYLGCACIVGSALIACSVPHWVHAAETAVMDTGGADTTPDRNALEEIVVTATKQGETRAQNTAIAISVFSQKQFDESGISDIRDLAEYTPNLVVSEGAQGAQIYIRGVGSNNVFNGGDPDVITQVDGVYIARPFEQLQDFLDVDRVEVLRGPQGTLYGRNAVGGVINVISREPTDTFSAKEQITTGNYGEFENQAYVSGPLVAGTLTGSLSTSYVRHDPYFTNIIPDQPGVADANHGGARIQLRWTPADQIDVMTRADYFRSAESPDQFTHLLTPLPQAPLASSTIGDFSHIAINDAGYVDERIWGISEDVNYRISDSLSLKSISAYRAGTFDQFNDADATELEVNSGYHTDDDEQYSQEFNIIGHFDALDVFGGLYYFHEHETSVTDVYSPPSAFTPPPRANVTAANSDSTASSRAVFSELDYHLTPSLKFSVGGRYTSDYKYLDQFLGRYTYPKPPALGAFFPGSPFIGSQGETFPAFTPKGGVEWQIDPDVLLYGTITKGFKSGGNSYSASSLVGFSYQPEKILSYEVGAKTEWLDHRLRLNVTGFIYDYTNLQVVQIIIPGLTSIGNAAKAKVHGAEFETVGKVTEHLTLTADLALLSAKYVSYPQDPLSPALIALVGNSSKYDPVTKSYNAAGNYLDAAPRSSFTLAAGYDQPFSRGDLSARVEYYWQDKIYFDPTNVLAQGQAAYGLINLNLGYTSLDATWDVRLIGRNLANKQYSTSVLDSSTTFASEGLAGPPRTVLLRLTRSW
jgi:iron complex outermembrane recepter protein